MKSVIKKRYKDYPPNVPKRLFRTLQRNNFDRSKTALALDVNSGYLSQLLNKGIEPPDTTVKGRIVRKKLFLKVHKINEHKQQVEKVIHHKPDFIIEWNHLPTEERQRVIKEYLSWKRTKRKQE